MQLIRDNLTLWTSEIDDEAEEGNTGGNQWKEEEKSQKAVWDIY
jgi:hypothetical protein